MITRQLIPNCKPQPPDKNPDKETRAVINPVTSKFALLQDTLLLSFTPCVLIEEYLKGQGGVVKSLFPYMEEKNKKKQFSPKVIDHDLVQVTSNLMSLCALTYPAVKVKC